MPESDEGIDPKGGEQDVYVPQQTKNTQKYIK
jgi:hypothetical protein